MQLLAHSASHFTQNVGQWDRDGLFVSRSKGVDLWVTREGALFDFNHVSNGSRSGQVVRMNFLGRTKSREVSPGGKQTEHASYTFGRKGKTFGADRYEQVVQHNVYRGIDVRYYTDSNGPHYDLIVNPGADPAKIALSFSGANSVEVSSKKVTLGTNLGPVDNTKLYAFQGSGASKHRIAATFAKRTDGSVAFKLGAYDRSQALIIDPLVYGSYYGGQGGWDEVRSVVADQDGGVFLVGMTQSFKFPALNGPYSFTLNGVQDAFVSKLQGDAYSNIYSSFVGGSGSETAQYAQLDPFGNLWVAGRTTSSDFPGSSRQNVQFLRLRQNPLEPTTYPNGGKFRLNFNGTYTSPLAYNASAATIQAALNAVTPGAPFAATDLNGGLPKGSVKLVSDPTVASGPITVLSGYVGPSNQDPSVVPFNVGLEARYLISEGATANFILNPGSTAQDGPGLLPLGNNKWPERTFKITYVNELGVSADTAPIYWTGLANVPNPPPDTLLKSLNALTNINGGKFQVSGGFSPLTWAIQFQPQATGGVTPPFGPLPNYRLYITYSNQDIFPGSTTNEDLFAHPVYESYTPSDLFVMKWTRTPDGLLNPLPTQSLLFGGDQSSSGTAYGLTLAGFSILQKSHPLPTDPVVIGFAGNNDGPLAAAPPSASNPLKGAYIARYKYSSNGGFQKVAVNYIGESAPLMIGGFTLDSVGNGYIAGTVLSYVNDDFPSAHGIFTTLGATWPNATIIRLQDCFIRKYSPDNSKIIYSGLIGGNDEEYLGGFDMNLDGSIENTGSAIAVDSQNNAYIVGLTTSFNFPRTLGTYGQVFPSPPGITPFVTKVSADASKYVYSTNLMPSTNQYTYGAAYGGYLDFGQIYARFPGIGTFATPCPLLPAGIAVDSAGDAFITGNGHPLYVDFPDSPPGTHTPGDPNEPSSFGLPTIPIVNALPLTDVWTTPASPEMPTSQGWLTVIDPNAQNIIYSSFIGGNLDEQLFAPYVDSFGDVWVMGTEVTNRGYVRAGTTPPPHIYGPENTGLPNSLISPLAFKSYGDNGGPSGTAVYGGLGAQEVPDGYWQSYPLTVPMGFAKDGIVIKLRVGTPAIQSVNFNPATVPGGQGATTTGFVTLSSAAPAGGASIQITLPNANVASLSQGQDVTALTILIPAGSTGGSFTVYTKPVTTATPVVVRATYLGSFQQAQIIVVPWLQGISVTPDSVIGGNPTSGRITLSTTAPSAGVLITLSTNFPNLISFPNGNTVLVPSGQQSATFVVQTSGVATKTFAGVTASSGGVNFTASVSILTANVLGLTFQPPVIPGLDTTVGTLTLDGQAGSAFTVNLSGLPAGYSIIPTGSTTPANAVAFAAGATSATFTVTTPVEPSQVVRTVVADRPASGGQNGYLHGQVNGSFTVTVVKTQSLTLTPSTVNGGQQSIGEVSLAQPAPQGGVAVNITADANAVSLSAGSFGQLTNITKVGNVTSGTLTIPQGATVGDFVVITGVSGTETKTTITADRGPNDAQTAVLDILAASFGLSIDPSSVVGGFQDSLGTVSLSSPAGAAGITISLAATMPDGVTPDPNVKVPASVTVTAGTSSATFPIHTTSVTTNKNVTIIAKLGTNVQTATLTVRATGLLSVTFTPASVRGGSAVLVQVTLDSPAPAGGLSVTLAATNSQFVRVPPVIVIPAGTTTYAFTLSTRRVSRDQASTLTATSAGGSAAASLLVTRGF